MSKKRTFAATNNYEQALDFFPQDDNAKPAKRAKCRPTPLSDTTPQVPPSELPNCKQDKAIAMEEKDVKQATSAWDRFKANCSYWDNILSKFLSNNDQETFLLENLHHSPIQSFVFRVATMKDEIFMLCKPENQDPFINVCDRDNMVEVKDVIPLPGILPKDMAACSVSNCVYVLNKGSQCFSVLRITKNEEHKFSTSPWINDLSLSFPEIRLFVSLNGNLIILSKQLTPKPSVVSIYSANGSLQCTITLFPAIHGFRFIFSVIQKSNGNLVLGTISNVLHTELKEIDSTGNIIRQYRSSIFGDSGVSDADQYGRIVIAGLGNRAELLDSEFNLLDLTVPQLVEDGLQIPYGMHYNSDRDEIVRLYEVASVDHNRVLTILRVTAEEEE